MAKKKPVKKTTRKGKSKMPTKTTPPTPKNAKFTRKRAVIVPQLILTLDEPSFIEITGPIYTGKEIKGTTGTKMDPAQLLPVINLTTGEICNMIANKVIEMNLLESYPDDSYIGRKFEIIKHDKKQGRKYFEFEFFEIE